MNLIKMNFSVFSLGLILLLTSCNKDSSNQKPSLNVVNNIDGLAVTLNGSVLDTDGTIADLRIEWGDEKSEALSSNEFLHFEKTHVYPHPQMYDITIKAYSNDGDSIVQVVSVDLDYKETSLLNIKSGLYKVSGKEILILTLNLHTYQETQQNEKFNLIIDVIGKMDIDFVAFQECAQHKSAAITEGIIREDNMGLFISNGLEEKYNVGYNIVWDWAHYGWNVWEEGVGILSKHLLIDTDERYISSNTSTGNITSRKAIYGSYQMTDGKINIFSAHTHWRTSLTDEEHNNQIENIKLMVDEKESITTGVTSFVCGDFNVNPTSDYPWSEGYNTMVGNNDYLDSFLDVYPDANNKPAQSIYNTVGGDFPGRIDYVFMKENVRYEVVESQIIFTNNVVGEVSDHFGVLTKLIDTE